MKTISKIFGLLLIVGIAFSFNSCSDDDDDPYTQKTTEFTYTYKIPVRGVENTEQKPAATTLELSDLLSTQNVAVSEFISGEFQRGKCHISVEGLRGLSETIELKDFKIAVGNRTAVSLGTCSPSGTNGFQSDVELMADKYTDIVKTVFEDLTKNRKSNVAIQFTPTEDVTNDDKKVYLTIKVTGLCKYKEYTNKTN
ncbi:MAG: hypothetical protein E6772_11045 [Dysgonomonas sp.]|nr:hypothetical protein [Dysgonomonas sp.]